MFGTVEYSDIRLLDLCKMDHKEPKTRTEKKGLDKQNGHGPYSAKHVRLQAVRSAEGKGKKTK